MGPNPQINSSNNEFRGGASFKITYQLSEFTPGCSQTGITSTKSCQVGFHKLAVQFLLRLPRDNTLTNSNKVHA